MMTEFGGFHIEAEFAPSMPEYVDEFEADIETDMAGWGLQNSGVKTYE